MKLISSTTVSSLVNKTLPKNTHTVEKIINDVLITILEVDTKTSKKRGKSTIYKI